MSDWTCTSCGQSSPAGMRFCGHCGAPAAAAPAPVQTWACRACGTANLPAMVFCGGCGAKSQPERAEEMRLVTALFADLSGFTTLADTLAVEDLHDVIRPLVAGLARIAERYGGFIEKYAGDALLVVFGAPVTHEDDAQRALLAALDMHATLPSLLAELGPNAAHLTIHIGVNTGRVISGRIGSEGSSDYAVLGDSVILAQRLESACPPGETYVGALTHELTSDDFEMESVGPLTLKGKLAPVEAYRLVGRRRAAASGARPLVGRDRELAAAEEGLRQAAVTTVVGEPGAGKSRLLVELRQRGEQRGEQWLTARCLSYGASLAYWPLADLLRQELQLPLALGAEATAAALAHALPAEAVPGARRLLGLEAGGLPETARREVHDAVAAWLRQRAERGPVVLVLEDLHWCDRSTVDLLAELVRVREDRLALLLATREEGRARSVEVAGEASHQVVEVDALDAAGTAAVAGSILGGCVGPGVVALLLERTNGNPLHVVELARSLSESGALVETVQGWDLRPGYDASAVPTSIERVFATRVDTLPPAAASVLQLASVIGRKVRLSLLREVHDGADLDDALQTLVETAMLEPESHTGETAYTFSHALLQDVVYERMLRKHRRQLHRRVADVARQLYGDADDSIGLLARHLYLAGAGEEAVDPLLRSGRGAASLFANETAAENLRRAAELLDELRDPRLPDALLELAEVQQLRGAYDDAKSLYERVARETDDAAAWAGLLAVLRARGEYDEVLQRLPDLLRRHDPRRPSAMGVWREGAATLALLGRMTDAVTALRTALRLLPEEEPVARGQLLAQLAYVESELNLHADATLHADQAVDLLDHPASLSQLVRALRIAGGAYIYAQDPAAARARLQRGIEVAEQIGLLEEAAACLLNLGMNDLEVDPASAAVSFRSALARFERLGRPSGRAQAYGNLADALLRIGDLDEADAYVDSALDLACQLGHRVTYADATLTRARIQLAAGDFMSAAETAEHAAKVFEELDDIEEVAHSLAVAQEAAARARDLPRARR